MFMKVPDYLTPVYSDDGHDEWLLLFANRNEVAQEYAELLVANGPTWPGWKQINDAISRRWSMAGLRYIKERAWKIARA